MKQTFYKIHYAEKGKAWCNDTGRYYGSPHLSSSDISAVTCKTCLKKHKRLYT